MHRAVAVAIGWGALEVGLSPVFALERPNGPERHQRTIALTLNRELQTFDDPITTPAPRLTDPLIPFVGRDLALRHPLQTGGSQSAPPPPGLDAQLLKLDHEGPPCQVLRRPPAILVHYRTPTEEGNSGSPVFLEPQWLAVALHHSGLEAGMYKLNGKPVNIRPTRA
jgi:hypothetical protein